MHEDMKADSLEYGEFQYGAAQKTTKRKFSIEKDIKSLSVVPMIDF